MSNTAGLSTGMPAHSPRKFNLASWRAEIGVAVALAVMIVFFSFNAPNFLTGENWATLLQQTSVIAIIAVGMTFVIITGEIDLSVGAQVGLSGTLFAMLVVNYGIPMPIAFLIVLLEAAAVGAFTGLLRVIWGIPTFITTLGLLSGLRGIAFYISDGLTIGPFPHPSPTSGTQPFSVFPSRMGHDRRHFAWLVRSLTAPLRPACLCGGRQP